MYSLVITSTVYVNSRKTAITDPDVRIKQYVESIMFYLKCDMLENIIVCDNSGFDYSGHFNVDTISKKNIEFLSFKGSDREIKKKGKGYGEGEIMNYVFSNSKLVQARPSFCKVTGRICVANINEILSKVNQEQNYFQRLNVNPFKLIKRVDTRFYYCKIETFRDILLSAYNNVNDDEGYYLENTYYDALNNSKTEYQNFEFLPRIVGLSGSSGLAYTIGDKKWVILKVLYSFFKKAGLYK